MGYDNSCYSCEYASFEVVKATEFYSGRKFIRCIINDWEFDFEEEIEKNCPWYTPIGRRFNGVYKPFKLKKYHEDENDEKS